jgi:cell volume regulation protein A
MQLETWFLVGGLVLFIAVFASKLTNKFGVPTLIIFVTLGMLMGEEGFGNIAFSDYILASGIAEIALVVILFSGGFDTSWPSVKKSAPISILLASVGVIITGLAVGLFAGLVFELTILEGLLLGAIISSTDAAAVFTILKTRNMNLKNELAGTLELESGSNDPVAYMMTLLFIVWIQGNQTGFALSLILQLGVGALVGLAIGYLATQLINRIHLTIDGLYFIIAASMVMLSFGLSTYLSGNGFLAVYLTGIVLGNHPLTHKISLVKFFDGLTWLMQILLFFTLGLLVFPSQVFSVIWQGLAVAAFLSFVARPIAVFSIMSFFKKTWQEMTLVSWVGFRGAASIVFAIYPLVYGLSSGPLIFNIVFFVAFFSVLIQGMTLIPLAKKLHLTEKNSNVLTTFTDYRGDTYADLLGVKVPDDSDVVGQTIMELELPEKILIVMIKRGKSVVTPRGHTELQAGDILMLASDSREELLEIARMDRFQSTLKKKRIEIDTEDSNGLL